MPFSHHPGEAGTFGPPTIPSIPTSYALALTLNINFPALDALVAYLSDLIKLQATVDALTAQLLHEQAKVKAAVLANTPAV